MSCQKNCFKLGRAAGVQAGISTFASRFGNAVGIMAGQAIQTAETASSTIGQTVAPVSNQVLEAIDRPTTILASLAPALVALSASTQLRLYATGPGCGARPGVAVALGLRDFAEVARNLRAVNKTMKIIRATSVGSTIAGNLAALLTKNEEKQRTFTQTKRSFLWGENQVEVEFTRSKLTGWLNRRDLLVSSDKVESSEGEVIQASRGLTTWHRGTTVVKMPGGESTLTHLHTLNLPPSSYYFDRALSEAEVADIVTGQGKPHRMRGYVGQVSAMENLAPGWALTKRAMILLRLHWPPVKQSGWVGKEEDQSASDETRTRPDTTGSVPIMEPVSDIAANHVAVPPRI